jgi:predicted DCC family thiol-disulfide oxidoreductase YuxK
MESYRKNNPQNRLDFIDISSEDFIAENYGKTQDDFMAQLHVRDADGVYYTGVDAFSVIWQAYPSGSLWRLVSAVVGLPGVNLLSRGGYWLFARYRHLLPKRNQDCDSGTCHVKH